MSYTGMNYISQEPKDEAAFEPLGTMVAAAQTSNSSAQTHPSEIKRG